ncbi:MAG: coproporphyrinogen III oxidase, partial [Rhodobacteraceae bacterium]|nr:coproporphyrinogen III oxidase [Paracoccaceae bacterium]
NNPRVSADLIYARQHQSPGAWRRELGEALAMGLGHLSLYQLTIEDGTAFGRRHAAGALAGLPDEDRAVELWEITQEMTAAAGLAAYEVSNHAATGAEGRHNLVYWRGGDYAGIGPGAHGRLTLGGRRWATEAHRAPGAWLAAVERDGRGEAGRTTLGPEEIALERLLMGLRLAEGVDLERLARLIDINALTLNDYVETGQLEVEGGFVRATPAGRLLLNAVLGGLAARL